jgi:uncharacterized protein
MQTTQCLGYSAIVAISLLNRLVKVMEPELIFCRNHHLLVILPGRSTLSLKDYERKMKNCRLPAQYTYALMFHCELERQYQLGHLFITAFCTPAHCIYRNTETTILPFWQRIQIIRETALSHFGAGIHKAKAFFQGACFYCAASNNTLAAFMLHQACELCLRAVVMAFTGEQVKTHTLTEQMQHVKKYLPELAAFFNSKTEKEKHQLNLLEKAYSQARYTAEYEMASADLQQLLQQVRTLHEATEQLMRHTLQSYPGYRQEEPPLYFFKPDTTFPLCQPVHCRMVDKK